MLLFVADKQDTIAMEALHMLQYRDFSISEVPATVEDPQNIVAIIGERVADFYQVYSSPNLPAGTRLPTWVTSQQIQNIILVRGGIGIYCNNIAEAAKKFLD